MSLNNKCNAGFCAAQECAIFRLDLRSAFLCNFAHEPFFESVFQGMDSKAVKCFPALESLSIANSPLPDLVEKLPGVGFIEERPFGIISTLMKPVGHECG